MAQNLPHLPDWERLSTNIIRIMGGNPSKFTLQGTNTYLLGSGPSRILIDTGSGEKKWIDTVRAVLTSASASPKPLHISTCLLTHWHHDHIGGVTDLERLTADLNPGHELKVYKNLPTWNPDSLIDPSRVHDIHDGQEFVTAGGDGDGDDDSSSFAIQAIHTPGHAKDHMVFQITRSPDASEVGALFTADNVLGHGTAVFEDLQLYLQSLDVMKRRVVGAVAAQQRRQGARQSGITESNASSISGGPNSAAHARTGATQQQGQQDAQQSGISDSTSSSISGGPNSSAHAHAGPDTQQRQHDAHQSGVSDSSASSISGGPNSSAHARAGAGAEADADSSSISGGPNSSAHTRAGADTQQRQQHIPHSGTSESSSISGGPNSSAHARAGTDSNADSSSISGGPNSSAHHVHASADASVSSHTTATIAKRAYPGHGQFIDDAVGKIDEYIAHRRMREEEALNVLKYGTVNSPHQSSTPVVHDSITLTTTGHSESGSDATGPKEVIVGKEWESMEMVRVIYRHYPENLWEPAEKGLLMVLEKLRRDGRVVRVGASGSEGNRGKWRVSEKAAL